MIDLHSHSTFSDGEKTPRELVAMAHNIGLSALALTDHDTVSGCQELQQAAQKYPDLLAINGVEFKVDHPADIEIIALNVSNLNPYLTREKMLLKNREETSYQRVEKLSQLGYHIAWENVAYDEFGNKRKAIAKPHIVNYLLASGQIDDKEFAYRQLLDEGCPAYVKAKAPTAEETIDFIRSTGAVSILAHPCLIHLKGQDLFNEITRLKKCGLQGMEVEHSDMSIDEVREYNQIADTLGMLKSGGSDYHGQNAHPSVELGFGKGDLNIPDEYIDKIIAAADSAPKTANLSLLKEKQSNR